MVRQLLSVGIALFLTACVPIPAEPPAASEQAGLCVSNERALLIGKTVETEPSADLPGYIDIVGVESRLRDQVLTVVIHLRDIPEKLTFHRNGVNPNHIEYSWMAWISEDGQLEPWADEVEKMTRFKHRLITAHFADMVDPLLLKSAAIASLAHSIVLVLKKYEDSEEEYHWFSEPLWKAITEVSHERDTLTMTGYVPGITRDSLLVIESNDYFEGQDRIRCASAKVSAPQKDVSELETASAQPASARAELDDLATILARMDGSGSSEVYVALLREFSNCFLSNLTARERVEGLDDRRSGFVITPAQITAVTLFQAGIFAVVGQSERGRGVERDDASPRSVNMLELLEGAVATCIGSRSGSED
ncbi:MAG: hypothetical protein OXF86_12205 [Caldilineaceae bacterium]|nr:hypothetical protein [Caldilineaceae bacterium]